MSSDSSNSKEEEEEGEEVNQLVLNRKRGVINPTATLAIPIVVPVVLIPVSSSDLKDFDNLFFSPIHPVDENVITHSYS